MPLAIFLFLFNLAFATWAYSNGESLGAMISAAGAVVSVIWIAFLVEQDL